MTDSKQRKALRGWIQGVRQGTVSAGLTAAVDTVNELLNDYEALDKITEKRTEFMRSALHAIVNAPDVAGDVDFPLKEMAWNALVADTKLADEQYKKLDDPNVDERLKEHGVQVTDDDSEVQP